MSDLDRDVPSAADAGNLATPGAADARLRNVIDALPTMTFLLDADGVLREANAAAFMATGLSPTDVIGRPLHETYWWSAEAEAQQRLSQALGAAKTGKVDRYQEKMRVGADRHITVMLHIAALSEASNDRTSFVVSATDVSDLVELQKRQTLLAGELTHRAKNILAIVKSLVSRAARRARTKEGLVRSLEGRINAMASAISQLSRAQWADYDLKEIICEQLEAADRDRISIGGPALQISPRATMAVALLIYELASNALKHGGLRDPDGALAIQWSVEGQSLRFSWRERCGSPIADPGDAGFGSTLIRNLVEGDLGAALNIEYRSHGLELQFDAPLSQLGRHAEEGSDRLSDRSFQEGVKGKRVLVMEFSPVIGLDLANMLETAGAIVFGPFTSIEEARLSLQQNRVDIAFLDVETRTDCVLSLARLAEKRGATLVLAAMEDNTGAVRKALPNAAVVSKPFSEIDAMQAIIKSF